MADLIFTIKTPAELKGVQDAITGFEQAKGKALAAGKAVDEYDAKIARAKASIDAFNASQAQNAQATSAAADAQLKEAAATEDATDKTKKLTLGKEDLKKIVTSLGQQFPLLGIAGRLALNPIVGAVVGLTYVINRSKEDYQKFRAELERSADLEGLKGPITAVKEAIINARDETEKFFGALNKAATANTSLATSADDTITALNNQAEKLRELDEVYKDHALAVLRYQKATGEITPEEFKARELDVENEFAARTQKRQADLDAARQSTLRDKFTTAETQRRELAPAIAPAIAAANEAEERAKVIVENKERARKNLHEQNALIAGTKDQPGLQDFRDQIGVSPANAEALSKLRSVDEFDQRLQYEQLPGRKTIKARRFVEANVALEAARDKQARLAQKARELDSAEEPAAQRAEQLRGRADAIKEKMEQLEADAKTLGERLKKAEADSNLNAPVRNEIERVKRATRGIETNTQIQEESKQKKGGTEGPQLNQNESLSPPPQGRVSQVPAAAVPDMAGEFAAYHQQNVALVNGLIAALRDGKRDLADLRSRNTDSMLS